MSDIKLTSKHLNLLESGPLELLTLNRPEMTLDQLLSLFHILSEKKLRRIFLGIKKIIYEKGIAEITSTELGELNSSFSSFIKN